MHKNAGPDIRSFRAFDPRRVVGCVVSSWSVLMGKSEIGLGREQKQRGPKWVGGLLRIGRSSRFVGDLRVGLGLLSYHE